MSSEPLYAVFRHLAIEGALRAPTEAELSAVEEELGAKLPESFKEFITIANGGNLDYVIEVPFGDGETEVLSFGSIYSASPRSHGTFEEGLDETRDRWDTPEGVLPFATDGISMVFLDLSPGGNGRVVAFVQGLPAWTGLRQESQFVELASSFDEYVSKLQIDRRHMLDQIRAPYLGTSELQAIAEYLDIGAPSWRDEDAELSDAFELATRNAVD